MDIPDDDASWSPMVPELACADLAESLAFYTGHLGFGVRYERSGFAYLEFSHAPEGRPVQLMLEQAGEHWSTGELERPFGRGINLQIETVGVEALHARLVDAGIALFRGLDLAWYRDGEIEHGVRQFLVQDPSGYLLRFMEPVGTRAAA
ncbi:MAG: VOC family protein [Pseudomonadota bacterium]